MDKGVICNDKNRKIILLNNSKTTLFQLKKMQTFAFCQPTTVLKLTIQQKNSKRRLEFFLTFWGAFTASELILFYYEKVNYKLKKFEARFIIRYYDSSLCNRFN